MTRRERVLMTIAHKEPDRIPLDLGSTISTGIHYKAYDELLRFLGFKGRVPEIGYLTSQSAKVDEDILEKFSIDIRGIMPGPIFVGDPKEEATGILLEDEWGIKWFKPKVNGNFYDMISHPLSDSSVEDLVAYNWINVENTARFAGIDEQLELYSAGEEAVVCGTTIGNGFLQTGNWLEGYENFLCDLALHSPKADIILKNIFDIKIRFWDIVLDRWGSKLDVVLELDDLGTQSGLLISPEMYRKMIKPKQIELFGYIKKKAPHIKILFHSCGSIRPIIPDLIQTGIDILNPVQFSAFDMDPVQLKKDFGRDIAFWGGGIDTQKTLSTGSVDEVKDEVKKMIDILAPGGGYIFTPVHNIQAEVPPANVVAMFETALEYGIY